MKTTIGRDDDEKSNEIPDDRRTRKYLKITSIDSNESDIDSVAAIFDHFKFERHSDRKWTVFDQCVLKQKLIQKMRNGVGPKLFIPFSLKSQAVNSKIRIGVIFGKYIEWSSTIEKYVQREIDWILLNGHFTLKFMNSIYFRITENVQSRFSVL